MLSISTMQFARRLAVQHIGYWRKAGADRLPKTRAWNRRQALFFIAASKGRVTL